MLAGRDGPKETPRAAQGLCLGHGDEERLPPGEAGQTKHGAVPAWPWHGLLAPGNTPRIPAAPTQALPSATPPTRAFPLRCDSARVTPTLTTQTKGSNPSKSPSRPPDKPYSPRFSARGSPDQSAPVRLSPSSRNPAQAPLVYPDSAVRLLAPRRRASNQHAPQLGPRHADRCGWADVRPREHVCLRGRGRGCPSAAWGASASNQP